MKISISFVECVFKEYRHGCWRKPTKITEKQGEMDGTCRVEYPSIVIV